MGTWAIDSFGNDGAADFLGDLVDGRDLALAQAAVARVAGHDGYLEAPDAAECLAACEVIAAAVGRPGKAAAAETTLVAWLARVKPRPDAALLAQAVAAVDRILAPESELRDLWQESDEFDDWKADVDDLRARLLG